MKDLATVFSDTFGNKSKFKILEALSNRSSSVTNISKVTGLEQTNVSHNLRSLSDYKIVFQKTKGRSHIYYLNGEFADFVESVVKNAKKHEKTLKRTGILAFALFLVAKPILTHEIGLLTSESSINLLTYFKLMAFN